MAGRTGEDLEQDLFLSASHTHHAGGRFWDNFLFASFGGLDSYSPEIFDRITGAIADAVVAALQDREAARIGVGLRSGFDPDDLVFHDRRFENDEGDLVDNSDPARADPATGELLPDALPDGRIKADRLTVIRIERADGSPKIALVHVPIHGTALSQQNQYLSTDVTGLIELKAREALGIPVVHFQGMTGDVQPAEENLDFAGMERIGELVAADVIDLFAGIETGGLAHLRRGIRAFRQDRRIVGYDQAVAPYDQFDAPFGAIGCGILSDAVSFLGLADPGDFDSPFQCLSRPLSFNVVLLQPFFGELLTPILIDDFTIDAFTEDLFEDFVIGLNPAGGPYEEPNLLFHARVGAFELGGIAVGSGTGPAGLRDLMVLASPGEPTTPWGFETRRKTALDLPGIEYEDTFILGYAVDHGGYILNQEDWLFGGSREIQINPWGPLWGEFAREQIRALARDVHAGLPIDPGPPALVGDPVPHAPPVPTASPAVGPFLSPVDVERLATASFYFVGGDIVVDLPGMVVERDVEGVFVPVERPGGRILDESGYETMLVYEYNETDLANPHVWSAHWQIDEDVPPGRYRFRVEGVNYDGSPIREEPPFYGGEPYAIASRTFLVRPSSALRVEDLVLSTSSFAATVTHPPVTEGPVPTVPGGFRDVPAPTGVTYRIRVESGGAVLVDAAGTLGTGANPIPALAPGTYGVTLDVEDAHGNTGSARFDAVVVG